MSDCSVDCGSVVVPAYISHGEKKDMALACRVFAFARTVTSMSRAQHLLSFHRTDKEQL